MTALNPRPGPARANAALAIFLGGLIAGVLDISSAFLLNGPKGVAPLRLLQAIASGLLGAHAYKGGLATAAVGLACHFSITFGAAAAYYAVSRVWPLLVRKAVVCGLLYGIVVYVITNYVVVPLSKIGRVVTGPPPQMIIGVVVLMVCVGLPIALMTRRYAG
jgi:uncharacterized membrane protein YagU involved in acid resistance